MIASAKDKAEGVKAPSQDKTKVPMGTIMWSKVRPAMHLLTCTCDIVEKFAKSVKICFQNLDLVLTVVVH